MSQAHCNCCGSTRLKEVLSLGEMPIAHRFHRSLPEEKEYRHPLTVHICEDCALIQIVDPIPPEVLYRDYNFCFTSWKVQPQTAREIALIKQCVGRTELIVEIGSNDGSFLNEMTASGLQNLIGVEPNREACAIARKVGVPIHESFYSRETADKILSAAGGAALVVSRQVVEHISDLTALMEDIRFLLKNDGWIMFEVPDFEVPMSYGDVSSLWEEHINYFTEPVMVALLRRHGFEAQIVERYPTNAGALMVLARRMERGGILAPIGKEQGIEAVRALAAEYASKAGRFRKALIKRLDENHRKGGKNVLYGTGCRANAVINGLGLQGSFDLLVDDQPEKQGLLMPGTLMTIEPSEAMQDMPGLCVLSVNAEHEEKVMQRHERYRNCGGRFYSANSPSPLYSKVLEL